MKRQIQGWVLDVYAAPWNGVSVWITDEHGVAHHLHDNLKPYFFISGTEQQLHAVCEWLNRSCYPVELKRTKRYEVFEHREIVLLQVILLRVNDYAVVVQRVSDTFPKLRLYHANLTIPQIYFLEKNLFAFAQCEVSAEDDGQIIEMRSQNSIGALNYRLPPLRVMTLAMESEKHNPKDPSHGFRGPIVVGYEGNDYVLSDTSPQEMLESLRRHLRRYDPDVILSEYGDSFLLGYLLHLAREYGVELPLSRDRAMHVRSRRAQSRFSYGKIMFQPASQILFGRLHVDRQYATLFDDYG